MEIIRTLIPTNLDSIKDFRNGVLESFKEKQMDSDFLFKTKLVLDELIANSYKHGNEYDESKTIEAVVISDSDFCLIKIKDEGDGIDYVYQTNRLSDHGRGIKLVYSLSDGLVIRDNTVAAILLKNQDQSLTYNT
ncbi:MAG: ATP-binding protein [Peptoniphilaceae bacterium]|nr:ATP-binding protein [Peptoniphilaceae bacterium]MDY6018241.1 ATP-binding protein [Anaerococcus sp.]